MRKAQLYELIDMALSERGHDSVSGVRCLKDELAWLEQRAVYRARADGLNWAEIARLLGTSRQRVHLRFAEARPPFRLQRPDRALERERAFQDLVAGKSPRPYGTNDDEPIAW
jgi:hypothetical protein